MIELRQKILTLLKELPTRNTSSYDEGQIDALNKVLDLISEIERKKWMTHDFAP